MQYTKAHQQLIRSLTDKKKREEQGLFIAEGTKIIFDLIESGCVPMQICALSNWFDKKPNLPFDKNYQTFQISSTEMERISQLSTPTDVLAIFHFERPNPTDFFTSETSPILYLDEIKDPGNLGTIIRTADWFGIKHIACSIDTVDCYNPKVIQATMGSIARVKIIYMDQIGFFNHLAKDYEIIGAFMEGESIHKAIFQKKSVIVIGNEGKGISVKTQKFISKKISIPKHQSQMEQNSIESLNASIACSIICYEFSKQLKSSDEIF